MQLLFCLVADRGLLLHKRMRLDLNCLTRLTWRIFEQWSVVKVKLIGRNLYEVRQRLEPGLLLRLRLDQLRARLRHLRVGLRGVRAGTQRVIDEDVNSISRTFPCALRVRLVELIDNLPCRNKVKERSRRSKLDVKLGQIGSVSRRLVSKTCAAPTLQLVSHRNSNGCQENSTPVIVFQSLWPVVARAGRCWNRYDRLPQRREVCFVGGGAI